MLGGGAVFMYWLLPHTTKFKTMNVQVLRECVIYPKAVTEYKTLPLSLLYPCEHLHIFLLYVTGAALRMPVLMLCATS